MPKTQIIFSFMTFLPTSRLVEGEDRQRVRAFLAVCILTTLLHRVALLYSQMNYGWKHSRIHKAKLSDMVSCAILHPGSRYFQGLSDEE